MSVTPAGEAKARTASAVAYWSQVRVAFNSAEASEPAAEPAPLSAEDIDGLSLDAFGEQRAALGIRHQDSDFIGLGSNSGSGFPDWRHPTMPEEFEISELDEYAATERAAAGIQTASSVFGAAPPTPRTHSSPYSI
jgi:hypothetical protein